MRKILRFPAPYKKFSLRKQNREGSCGPNSMKYALFYKQRLNIPEHSLINLSSCSEKNGASIEGMVKIAKDYALNYELKHHASISDLENSIENGNPVILLIQAWPNRKIRNGDWARTWEFGHYVLGLGYDNKLQKLFYYDPYDGKEKEMHYKTLNGRWHGLDLFPRNCFGIFIKD